MSVLIIIFLIVEPIRESDLGMSNTMSMSYNLLFNSSNYHWIFEKIKRFVMVFINYCSWIWNQD